MGHRLHADPGLQPERNWLSWRRTMVSLTVVGVMSMRWLPHHSGVSHGLMVLALFCALLIGKSLYRRYCLQAGYMNRGDALPATVSVVWLSVAVLSLATASLVAVLGR